MSLKEELKELIIDECDKDISIEDIKDSDELFNPNHPLGLDSLDSLQISMALQNRYGIRLTDPKEVRRVMESIDTLAKYIESNR